MKIYSRIFILITITLTISCVKPAKILIPPELRNIPSKPVIGGQGSWKIQFGGFLFYNFIFHNQNILYLDTSSMFQEFMCYEFVGELENNIQQNYYCEFPIKTFIDPSIRCIQIKQNFFQTWDIVNDTLSIDNNKIIIEPYSLTKGSTKPKKYILDYIFKESDNIVGFLDISKKYDETVWIVPNVDMTIQNSIASAMMALIIKHRKWYEEFYINTSEGISIEPLTSPQCLDHYQR